MEILAGYYSPTSIFSTLPKELIGHISSLMIKGSKEYYIILFNALGHGNYILKESFSIYLSSKQDHVLYYRLMKDAEILMSVTDRCSDCVTIKVEK